MFFKRRQTWRKFHVCICYFALTSMSCGENSSSEKSKYRLSQLRFLGQFSKSCDYLVFEGEISTIAFFDGAKIEVVDLGNESEIMKIPLRKTVYQDAANKNNDTLPVRFFVELELDSISKGSLPRKFELGFRICSEIRECGKLEKLNFLIHKK